MKNSTKLRLVLALAAVVAAVAASTGCVAAPHVRDEATVGAFDRAIKAREDDFGRLISELEACRAAAASQKAYAALLEEALAQSGATMPERPKAITITSDAVVKGLRALNEAEVDRLKRCRNYEDRKLEEAPR